ncbi:MAG: methyltransferase domain-containing protein [Desulfobacteraceae bacterium]|nr:methyltransferase domain-containing protein [Desulfobacteraceae bacterium]
MSQKHTPESLLTLSWGIQRGRLLLTGAELDIFTMLAPSPLSAEEVTERLRGNLRAVTILLNVLTAMDFLIKKGGRYQTEQSAARLLSSQEPNSLLPMVKHGAHLWRTWSRLTDIVSDVDNKDKKDIPERDEDDLKAFIGAMHLGALRFAPEVVAAVDAGQAKFLIDVGGGSGSYTLTFLEACPDMKATLFDLLPVIEMARERVKEAGLTDRVNLVPGDFYKDELPPGHDLALVSAIIHQNSPEQNQDLYGKVFRSLDSGGRIVIRDHVMESDRTRPVDGAIFAVNMLVNTSGGGTWTYDEINQGLTKAGFTRVKQLQSKGMLSLVEAFKP